MGKRRRWQFKALSFLLVLIMVLEDGAAVAVRAEEKNASAVRTVQENTGSVGKETGSTAGDDGGIQDTGTLDENDRRENTGGDKKEEAGGESAEDAEKEGTGSQNTDDKTPDTEEKPDTGREEGKDPGTNPSGGADPEPDKDNTGEDGGIDSETDKAQGIHSNLYATSDCWNTPPFLSVASLLFLQFHCNS